MIMKTKIYFAFALAMLLTVSCQKENEDGITLKAIVTEQPTDGTKTHFDNSLFVCWDNGDRVRVNNNNDVGLGSGIHEVVVDASGNATISHVKANGNGYRAVYPASLSNGTAPSSNTYNTITLPVNQTYDESKIPIPMVAHAASGDDILSFRPVTSLMKVKVIGNLLVKKIVVSGNGTPLAGAGTITGSDDAPVLTLNTGGPDSVVLDCGKGVRVTSNKIFNVIIPATTARFTIRVDAVDVNGEVCSYSRTQSSSVSIDRCQIGGVPFDVSEATCTRTGRLVGKFQVSANTYCYFSKGNLQYEGAGSTGIWKFANRQEETLGSANAANIVGDAAIDLFGWGSCDNPRCHTSNVHDYNYGTDNLSATTDWGKHPIENGGGVGGYWQTLSYGQWNGIFTNQTWGFSVVNEIRGIVIITQDMSVEGRNIESSYTADAWADMAVEGAVFLPVTGWRANGASVSGLGSGAYWSSSASGNEGAHYLGFTPTSVAPRTFNSNDNSSFFNPVRYRGLAVRLVKITY